MGEARAGDVPLKGGIPHGGNRRKRGAECALDDLDEDPTAATEVSDRANRPNRDDGLRVCGRRAMAKQSTVYIWLLYWN